MGIITETTFTDFNKLIDPCKYSDYINIISLSNLDNNLPHEVLTGSIIGVANNIYQCNTDEEISLIDPYTGIEVVEGMLFIMAIVSGNKISFSYTNTEPTWSDIYLGWYGSGLFTGARYTKWQILYEDGVFTSSREQMINQWSRPIYYLRDSTIRTLTLSGITAYTNETNATLSFYANNNEIWSIYLIYDINTGSASTDGCVTGLIEINTLNVLFQEGNYFSAPGGQCLPVVDIKDVTYLDNLPKGLLYGKIFGANTQIDVQQTFYQDVYTSGTDPRYVKNRRFIAIKDI